MKDFVERLARLEGVKLYTAKRGIPFKVVITDINVRAAAWEAEEGDNPRTAYPLDTLERICDYYITGGALTPEALSAAEIYKRKKGYSYLPAIVRAIVDGP